MSTKPTVAIIREELGPLENRLGELEQAFMSLRELANAKPVSLQTLAELGLLSSMNRAIDARLEEIFAAALADPNLGDTAVDELEEVGGPAAPGHKVALRAASKALAGYALRWLNDHRGR